MEAFLCSGFSLLESSNKTPTESCETGGSSDSMCPAEDKNSMIRNFNVSRSLVTIGGGSDSGDFVRISKSEGPLICGEIVTNINGHSIAGCTWEDADFILSSSEETNIVLIKDSSNLSGIAWFLKQDFKPTCYLCYLQTIVRSNLYYRTTPYTTRKRKPHERNHNDFHFVSKKKFLKLLSNEVLLEWRLYNGVYYGTPMPPKGRCFFRMNGKSGGITTTDNSVESSFSFSKSNHVWDTINESIVSEVAEISTSSFDHLPTQSVTKREVCDYFWWCHSLVVGAEEFEIVKLDHIGGSNFQLGIFGLYGIGKCSIIVVEKPSDPLQQNDIIVSMNCQSMLWLKDSKLHSLFTDYKGLPSISLLVVRGFSLVSFASDGMYLPVGWRCDACALYEDTVFSVKTKKRPQFFIPTKNDVKEYLLRTRGTSIDFDYDIKSLKLITSNLPFSFTKLDEISNPLWIVDVIYDSCHVEIGDILVGIGGRSTMEVDSTPKILRFVRQMADTSIVFYFARGLAHLIRRELPKSLKSYLAFTDCVINRTWRDQPFEVTLETSSYGKLPKLISSNPDYPNNVKVISMNGIFLPYLSNGLISAYMRDFKKLELHFLIKNKSELPDASTLSPKCSSSTLTRTMFSSRSSKSSTLGKEIEEVVTRDHVINHFQSTRGISVPSNQFSVLDRSVTKGSDGIGIRVSACDGVKSLHSLLIVHECVADVAADIKPGDLIVAIGGRSLHNMNFDDSLKTIRALKPMCCTKLQIARGLSYLIRNPIQYDGPKRVCTIKRLNKGVPFGIGLSFTFDKLHPVITRLENDSPSAQSPFVRLGLIVVGINGIGLGGLSEGVIRSILETVPDLSLVMTIAFKNTLKRCSFSSDLVFDTQFELIGVDFRPGLTFRDIGVHVIAPTITNYPAIVFVEGNIVPHNSFLRNFLFYVVAVNDCPVEGVPTVPSSPLTLSVLRHEFKIHDLKHEDCYAYFVVRDKLTVPFGLSIIGGGYSYPTIANVGKFSPASRAGVPYGVEVLAIDGVDCKLLTRHDIALKLRGNESNTLYLLVRKMKNRAYSLPQPVPTLKTFNSLRGSGIYDVNFDGDEGHCGIVLQGGRSAAPHIVRYLVQGSVASRSQVKVGDEVIRIDGEDVTKLSRSECIEKLSSASVVRARSSLYAPVVADDV